MLEIYLSYMQIYYYDMYFMAVTIKLNLLFVFLPLNQLCICVKSK